MNKQSNGGKKMYKIIFIGNSGVGKTQILARFNNDIYKNSTLTTINVDFVFKDVILNNDHILCQFWDTAGLERYNSLNARYYRDSHAFVFVLDLTRKDTLYALERWINDVKNEVGTSYFDNSVVHVIGNKNDIDFNNSFLPKSSQKEGTDGCSSNERYHSRTLEFRCITREEVHMFLKDKLTSYSYYETSAKTGTNITNCMMNLIGKIHMTDRKDEHVIEISNVSLNVENSPETKKCCN